MPERHKTILTRPDSGCEMVVTRTFDAPRAKVWRAWTDPARLAQWWGPNGFTITTHEMQFKKDGFWRLTMHGPDGRDYKNKIVYLEIREPELILYKHAGEEGDEPVKFQTEVRFVELGPNLTKLTMHAKFATPADLKYVIDTYGADKGGIETITRLAAYIDSNAD